MFAGLAAKWALAGGFKGVVKLVPRWAWIALAVALVALAGVWWHGHKVKAFGAERFTAGYAKAVADGKQRVARLERKSSAIASTIRSKTDEENRRIARSADALRLRGPGAAACDYPRLPVGAGRHDPAGGGADAAPGGVPDQDRASVPFDWLVGSAEAADANRNEVLAWREWHQRLTDEWARTNAASTR